jgi:hypothetical protein
MDTEQIPVVENNEQISAPEPISIPDNQSSEEKKGRASKSGPIVAILVFFIVVLVCGLTYFVLKDRGINLLSGIVKDSTTNTKTSTTDESKTEDTTCTTDTESTTNDCTVALDNAGWVLFNVPSYKFSVEIPSYGMTQEIGTENVGSVWKAWHSTSLNGMPSLYSDYLHSVNITFYPLYIPEGTGCGQGCVDEHNFRIDIYNNKGGKDLVSVKNQINTAWKALYDQEATLTWESSNKWGKDVQKFNASLIGGYEDGYLVVTKDYVYDITYFISASPAESYQVAQKVLDSMKFEE